MALSLIGSSAAYAPTMLRAAPTRAAVSMDIAKEDLAKSLNPVLGYYDPLGLGQSDFWGAGKDATYGFLRQAEIKHGRVAMAAFVGYCVQANGIHFPYLLGQPTSGVSPEEQWFNLPVTGRLQIILFIGFLEFWGEFAGTHYKRGGKPGVYPAFDSMDYSIPFPPNPPSLYDPFGVVSKQSDEKKASGLLKEINNGRLAMLGIMGFVSESHVPGSVPALTGIVKPFAGDVMAPFV